jgi:hypothetical protein
VIYWILLYDWVVEESYPRILLISRVEFIVFGTLEQSKCGGLN